MRCRVDTTSPDGARAGHRPRRRPGDRRARTRSRRPAGARGPAGGRLHHRSAAADRLPPPPAGRATRRRRRGRARELLRAGDPGARRGRGGRDGHRAAASADLPGFPGRRPPPVGHTGRHRGDGGTARGPPPTRGRRAPPQRRGHANGRMRHRRLHRRLDPRPRARPLRRAGARPGHPRTGRRRGPAHVGAGGLRRRQPRAPGRDGGRRRATRRPYGALGDRATSEGSDDVSEPVPISREAAAALGVAERYGGPTSGVPGSVRSRSGRRGSSSGPR